MFQVIFKLDDKEVYLYHVATNGCNKQEAVSEAFRNMPYYFDHEWNRIEVREIDVVDN